MSVKVIACLNPVSTQQTVFTSDAKSIADILRELDSGFPLSHARVSRNGEIVTDFSLTANDGDTLWIKFVPYGSPQSAGAGMKGGGWILAIIGIALVATGIGGAIGAALIGTGLSMTLGGTVLMNIDVPSSQEKPENDPSIRGGKNQMRQYGRIPVLFGRHRVYPDLAANPYTSIIDGKQYYTQLLCGGYKDCVIDLDSIKLGETPLADLSQTKSMTQMLALADPLIQLEILQNGETSSLYPYCVHEEAVNAVIEHQVDDGDGNMISGEVISTTPDNTDTINIDIFFYNGLGKYNDENDLKSTSVEVRASYKKVDEPDSAYQSLGFFNGSSNTISGAELKTKRFQVTKDNLPSGQYTVKIERVTSDSSDTKVIDQVYIGSIRSIKSKHPIRYERQKELTVIALRVLATSKLNNVLDSFNYVAESTLPVFSGNALSAGSGASAWLTSSKTRNPASMLLYALKGRAAQQIVADDDIDYPSLEKFYTWCKEHEYFCDAYISESVTIAELLRMIGSTSRADILRIDSKISVIQDIKRASPMQLFTPKNTKSYSITMFSADIPDAIALNYIDADAGYAQNECKVYNTPDGNKIAEPETTQKVELWGITDSAQARRIGMYNYACLKHRPFVHAIEVDIEYLLCNKGDWIQYAGDIALAGSTQGRIREVIRDSRGHCLGFIADERIEMDAGKTYAVRIRTADGKVILENIRTNPGAINEIEFISPIDAGLLPKAGDLYAFGERGMEALDLVITDIQPGSDLSAALTCVEYSPVMFNVDNPDFVLPDFENKITPVSGAVDSGIVTPDDWKYFVTYHDGEAEPERPIGSGDSNGWHHVQTPLSVWQSSKTAAAVDLGVWNPPVRIITKDDLDAIVNSPEKPQPITNMKAIAGRDFIHITWDKPYTGFVNNIQKVTIEIQKAMGGKWERYEAPSNEYAYQFDRTKDGYPEKSNLINWRIRAKSVNIYGNESIEYAGGVSGISIDLSQYGTWIPDKPIVIIASAGRTVSLSAQTQHCYGYSGVEYQINDDNGNVWYAPRLEASDVKTNEDAWKGKENDVYYALNGELTQSLPLKGQTLGLPKNTVYYYRCRAVTKKDDGTLLHNSDFSESRPAMAQATEIADIVENAISTAQIQDSAIINAKIKNGSIVAADKIAANSVSTENLNVLAKNVVNNFVNGTKEGWSTGGVIFFDEEIGMNVLEVTYPNLNFKSNTFQVLPNDIYEFKFGIQCMNYSVGSGIYIGLTLRQKFYAMGYDNITKKWILEVQTDNAYFLSGYKSGTKKYFKTYILGSNVDISSVPAPEMTDATYPVKCLKLSGHDITCQIRSGYNSDQIAGTKYRFICPQIYKAGAGKIVANNITANTLSAISAQLGEVGDGPDYNLTLSEGMTHPRGTFLLGSTTDTAYFRRWFANGVWNMAIKLASFIVDSVSSKVKGMFQVFRTTDNEAAAKPAFQVNPGSAAGSESTEIRGAFRVKKSTALSSDADQPIFEALPNGEINSLGKKISVEVGSARTTVRYTGFIKIKIPHKIDGNMLSFIVNIYGNYSSSIINITGYLYRTIGDWYSPKAELVSGISRKVDFGIDTDGFVFVAISGNIEYVTVSVTNYIESYDSIGFKDKWEVSFVDSLSGSISVSYQNIYGRNIYSELSTTDINIQRDATIQRDLSVNGGLLTKNNALFQGNVQVNGNLVTEPLKVNTNPLYANRPSYSAGTSIQTLMDAEFSFWGKPYNAGGRTIDKAAAGFYGTKAISRINIHDQGRAGAMNISGVTFTYTDGSTSGLLKDTLTQALTQFRYKTDGWTVWLTNLPTEDPKVAGVLWRNGNSLIISAG